MSKIFDMNNPFWSFIGKLIDVFVLHILWLVCSLPLVTFGASTAALYYALMKDCADEETHYVKAFFHSFKQNLKQGVVIGLIFLLSGGLLAFAFSYYTQAQSAGTVFSFAKAITITLIVLYIVMLEWVFPFLARFDNTTKRILETSFFLSIKHIGWTLVMAVIFVAVYFVILYFNFIPLLLLGYGLVAYLNSYILNHVFAPYIRAQLEKEGKLDADKDPDAWTVELDEDAAAEGTAAEETADSVIAAAENEAEKAIEDIHTDAAIEEIKTDE